MDEANRETETQDFMNVESFSQLPFIRRPPSKDNNPNSIRLFGKDFTGGDYSGTTGQEDYSGSSETNNKLDDQEDQTGDNSTDNSSNNNNNSRRFECHYCFRNFPTSQALGGHQNAHKRERQLAKRGASSYFHHPDASLYGYRHYPSWSTTPLPAARFYGGQTYAPSSSPYYSRPINGNPVRPWRVLPSSSSSIQDVYNSNAAFTSHDSSNNSTLPLLAGSQPPSHVGGSAVQTRMSSYRYGLPPNAQGHVSLDLHL